MIPSKLPLSHLLFAIVVVACWILGAGVSCPAMETDGPKVAEPQTPQAVENIQRRQTLAKSTQIKLKPADENGATEPGETWIRIHRDSNGEPLALQTAIVRYRPVKSDGKTPKGLTVDLIGAVHVGDRAYYAKLNRRFEKYESLLYELVAPKGTVVEKGRGTSNAHPVGALQNGMKGLLGLEHQLEHINYTRKNFVHADMTPKQLGESMDDRGESFMQMYFRLMGAEMARQSKMQAKGKSAEFGLLAALFAKDRPRRLKIALAEQFENIESLMVGFNGPDGSTLITERNKVALQVLSKQIKAGRRNLGVFYGAGHLPDMDERLKNEFRLRPVSVTWVDAWNLRAK